MTGTHRGTRDRGEAIPASRARRVAHPELAVRLADALRESRKHIRTGQSQQGKCGPVEEGQEQATRFVPGNEQEASHMQSRPWLPLVLLQHQTSCTLRHANTDGVLEIEAHAPSVLVIQALAEGAIAVMPLVREGGSTRARCYVDGTETDYGRRVEVALAPGDALRLECRVRDKEACWNYWKIARAYLVGEIPEPLFLVRHAFMGDVLSILAGTETYAVCNGIPRIRIAGAPLIGEVLEQFDFPHVEYVSGPGTDADPVFDAAVWGAPWLEKFGAALHARYGGVRPLGASMPRLRRPGSRPSEDVIVCQFDGRSSGCHSLDRMQEILAHHDGMRRVALGGPDTPRYLGSDVEYRLGPLPFLLEQLQSAAYHIGVDSGIAHLAAAVGLPSVVYHGPRIDAPAVRGFFSGYPRTTVCMAEYPPRARSVCVARSLLLRDGSPWASPDRYFDFLGSAHELDASAPPPTDLLRSQVLILGGGSLLPRGLDAIFRGSACPADLKIAWGIGHSGERCETLRRSDLEPFLRGYDLISIRETELDYEWVPCPSCMNRAFDHEYPILAEVAVYENAGPPSLGLPFPTAREDQWDLTTEAGLQAALTHLGSGAKVVTNAYYGAYWATLLGRPVVYLSPHCPFRFRYQPATGPRERLERLLQEAHPYPEALGETRKTDLNFAVRVKALLKDYGALS